MHPKLRIELRIHWHAGQEVIEANLHLVNHQQGRYTDDKRLIFRNLLPNLFLSFCLPNY